MFVGRIAISVRRLRFEIKFPIINTRHPFNDGSINVYVYVIVRLIRVFRNPRACVLQVSACENNPELTEMRLFTG